jgi:hypothetical protein
VSQSLPGSLFTHETLLNPFACAVKNRKGEVPEMQDRNALRRKPDQEQGEQTAPRPGTKRFFAERLPLASSERLLASLFLTVQVLQDRFDHKVIH